MLSVNEQLYNRFLSRRRLKRRSRLVKLVTRPRQFLYSEAVRRLGSLGLTSVVQAQTFWGDRMTVVLPELTSTVLYRHGYSEEDVVVYVLFFLGPGMCFFDLGGHFGFYSLLAARLIGERGRVTVFEPTPSTASILEHNVAGDVRITVERAAVWDSPGEVELTDFGLELCSYNAIGRPRLDPARAERSLAQAFRVPAISLDAYCAKTGTYPDFVKVDVENSEAQVVRGAPHVLERIRPIVSLEIGDLEHSKGSPSRDLIDVFVKLDYEPFEHRCGKPVPHRLQACYEEHFGNLLLVPKERPSFMPLER